VVNRDEASHQGGDFVCCRVEREMTCIENMHERVPHIPPVRLRLRSVEGQIVLSPNHEESRLRLAHPRLPLGIGFDICAVVVEEIALNVGLAQLIEKGELVRPERRTTCGTPKAIRPRCPPILLSDRSEIAGLVSWASKRLALRYFDRLSHAAADFGMSRLEARIRVPVSLPYYMCMRDNQQETADGKESD